MFFMAKTRTDIEQIVMQRCFLENKYLAKIWLKIKS